MALLVVMGSGETAPTMVRTHRRVLGDTPAGGRVILDTTFGFQNNADDLVRKTRTYFSESVGVEVEPASWRSAADDLLDRERALSGIAGATWAFAGPGSPSYALRQWHGTPVPPALTALSRRGGTLVFGSAAAVTLGSHALPVYEIYKAGADPAWLEGLDLLGSLAGLPAALVPHYDNNEGGSYDTRFCYLGEPRLRLLESALPEGVGVLGVDEHTALLMDLTARTATVAGSGVVTARYRGRSTSFADGAVIGLDALAALLCGREAGADAVSADAPQAPVEDPDPAAVTSLRAAADSAAAAFDAAMAARDANGCVTAVLQVEESLDAWRMDSLDSDDADHARRVLRSMVVRLGELADVGARDPREVVGPYVEALLAVRAAARDARDFGTSDLVRDRLGEIGVEVRDTPDGVQWSLTSA